MSLRAGEMERMQRVQADHMMDACQILAFSSTEDAYNIPQDSYTARPEIACGFGFKQATWREVQEESEVPITETVFRLPMATAVDPRDRIRLTKRFGETVPAQDYEIIGEPQRGPSGLVVKVKLVTDGSS